MSGALVLSGKQISCTCANFVSKTLTSVSDSENLVSLFLDGNLLKARGLGMIIEDYLSTSAAANLRGLDLSDNLLERDSLPALIHYVASAGCQLDTLRLRSNAIGAHAAVILPSIRPRSQGGMLRALDLSDVDLGDDGALAIAESIPSKDFVLTSLSIERNGVTDVAGELLVRMIGTHQTKLAYLSLADNKCTDITGSKYLHGITANGYRDGSCFLELKGNPIDSHLLSSIEMQRGMAKTGMREDSVAVPLSAKKAPSSVEPRSAEGSCGSPK